MLQHDLHCHAGPDATLTICLWQQGFAITDPDPGHRLKQDTLCTLMDPDPAVSTLPGPYAKANDMIIEARLSIEREETAKTGRAIFLATVIALRPHQAPYAKVTTLVGFHLLDPPDTIARWYEQIAQMRMVR